MDQLSAVVGTAILVIVCAIGLLLFRTFAGWLDARLRAGWRWLTLPITAFLCVAGFVAIRPLIVDQPRTPLWFAMGLIAVALLFAGATALGLAVVGLGRWLVSGRRGG